MSGHNLLHQLGDAMEVGAGIAVDPGDGGTIDAAGRSLVYCKVVPAGDVKTPILPSNASPGDIVIVANADGTGEAVVVKDSGATTVATLDDGQGALCLFMSENSGWVAVILVLGAT